jgi:alanine racemase
MTLVMDYKTQNWIEISRSKLIQNVNILGDLSQYIMPIIKSNAYSHGIKEIVTILSETNLSMYVVDSYHEAVEAVKHTSKPILILGYIEFDRIDGLNTEQFSFAVDNIATIDILQKLSKNIKIHLEINTGMNRCGFDPDDLDDVIAILQSCPNIIVEGIFSHLADSDNAVDDYTEQQTKIFDSCVETFLKSKIIPKYIHLGQTAGSAKNLSKYANASRPGIGIYGFNPLEKTDTNFIKLQNLQPVLSVKSKFVKIFSIKVGESVGYNCTFVAKVNTTVGLIPFGYYEGLPRSLSNIGCVSILVNGRKKFLPIIGRVCMNFVMVDLLGFDVKVAKSVEIISNQNSDPNSVIHVAKLAGTIPWEILTNFKGNIHRQIVD